MSQPGVATSVMEPSTLIVGCGQGDVKACLLYLSAGNTGDHILQERQARNEAGLFTVTV